MSITGKKRAAIEIPEVYRNLTEGAPDSIVAVDLKGNITYCNKATEILTGYTQEKLIGKHFSRLGSMENREIRHSLKLFKKLLSGKKVSPLELQARHKDGKPYWVEVHLSRIKVKGKVTGFQVSARDITERKNIETALVRKERIATERAHLLNDLRSLNRLDDILTRVCKSVRDSGLFERAVMTLHKPGGRIVHLGQVGLPRKMVERAKQAPPIDDKLKSRINSQKFRISDSFFVPVEAGLDYTKTKRYIPPKKRNSTGGDWQPGDELFVPLWSSSGQIMGYLSVDTPMDGYRPDVKTIQALEMLVEAAAARVREVQAHQSLRESEEKFRNLADQSPNMIFIYSRGRVIYTNEKCEKVMGYKREEFYAPDFDFLTLIAPEDRELVKASLGRHFMGKEVAPYEYAIITKKGKKIQAILSAKVISYRGENAILGIITDITERKRAEEETRKFKTISDRARYGSAISDLEGNLIYINESFAQMHGYKAGELIGKNLSVFHNKEQMKDVERLNKQLIQKGSYIAEEVWHKRKDGTVFPTLMSLTTVEDEKGKPLFMAATAIDITDRKRAEEALQESEEKYRLLVENASEAIIVAQDGWLKFVNHKMTEIMGYSKEELRSKPFVEFIHPEDQQMVLERHIKRLKGEKLPHVYPFKIVDKDGNIKWLEINAVVITWEGRPASLNFLSDITERKKAEKSLCESENKYRRLIENLPQKIFLKDKNSVYVSCNENYARDLKIKPEEIAGKNDYDFYPRELAEKYRADDQRIIKSENTEDIEERYIQNGRELWVHTLKTPVKDEKGQCVGLLGIFWDITERKRVEEVLQIERERLETVTQNVGVGLAIISKDYRTLWANEVLKQMFGEVEGKICYSTYNQRSEICPGCGVREVFGTGRDEVVHEQVGKDKEGKPVWSQIVATPIKDKEGNITAALEVVVDITERKQVEKTLRESEERYRSLFEDSPISLWEEDFSKVKTFLDNLRAKGVKDFGKHFEDHPKAVVNCANMVKVIDVNNASLELFKAKSKEELQGALANTFSEESYDAFREELISIALGKTVFESEAIAQTLKGDRKHVVIKWSVAPGYEQTLSKVLVSISDVTELKKAREQNLLLETSKALSRTLKLDQVLKIAGEKMAEALKPDRCSVALFDESADSAALKHLVTKKDSPSSPLLDKRTPPDDHFSQVKEILLTKGYLKIANVKTDFLPGSIRSYFLRTGIKSSLIIPIIVGKNLFGAFHLVSERLRNFASEEVSLAQTIANQVAVALQNCRLMEDLERKHGQISEQADLLRTQYGEQKMLFELAQTLSSTLDLDQMLKFATQKVTELLKTERSSIILVNPDGKSATIKALYIQGKFATPDLVGYTFDSKAFPQLRELLARPDPLVIPDTSALPQEDPLRTYFLRRGKMKSTVAIALQSGGKVLGFLTVGTIKEVHHYTSEEIQLLQTVANSIAVVIENARLLELLRKTSEDLKTLSSQLIKTEEDERKKIAQDLHDQIGQTLFAMKINLEIAKKNLPPNLEKLEDIRNRLSETEDLLSRTIEQTRNLTADLRPSTLDDFGLIPALNTYISDFSKRTNIKVSLRTQNFKPRLSSEIETMLYRIIQEALTNVAKHAQATEISVLLARKNFTVSLSVQDNGIGFDAKKITIPKDRLGLFNIKERVKLLNGEFEIDSKPNKGTKLNVKIPLTVPIYRDTIKTEKGEYEKD